MTVCSFEFIVDLIVLGINDFDVMLGMDWLFANHITVNCPEKHIISTEKRASGIFQEYHDDTCPSNINYENLDTINKKIEWISCLCYGW